MTITPLISLPLSNVSERGVSPGFQVVKRYRIRAMVVTAVWALSFFDGPPFFIVESRELSSNDIGKLDHGDRGLYLPDWVRFSDSTRDFHRTRYATPAPGRWQFSSTLPGSWLTARDPSMVLAP